MVATAAVRGVADDRGDGGNGLLNGARAVGDSESSGLGDGVSVVVVDDRGRLRAVGGVGGNDLSDVGDVAVGRGAGGEGKSSSEELHFDGCLKCPERLYTMYAVYMYSWGGSAGYREKAGEKCALVV